MMNKMWEKYKGIFWYGFFGICTTIINIAVYGLCSLWTSLGTVVATIIAWIAAVIFAFFTNRKYVFDTTSVTFFEKLKEFFRFICSRLSTGAIDIIGMYVFVDILQFDEMAIKILMNILIIVLNYIASKKIVFH